jgi:hypothetical protein
MNVQAENESWNVKLFFFYNAAWNIFVNNVFLLIVYNFCQ